MHSTDLNLFKYWIVASQYFKKIRKQVKFLMLNFLGDWNDEWAAAASQHIWSKMTKDADSCTKASPAKCTASLRAPLSALNLKSRANAKYERLGGKKFAAAWICSEEKNNKNNCEAEIWSEAMRSWIVGGRMILRTSINGYFLVKRSLVSFKASRHLT